MRSGGDDAHDRPGHARLGRVRSRGQHLDDGGLSGIIGASPCGEPLIIGADRLFIEQRPTQRRGLARDPDRRRLLGIAPDAIGIDQHLLGPAGTEPLRGDLRGHGRPESDDELRFAKCRWHTQDGIAVGDDDGMLAPATAARIGEHRPSHRRGEGQHILGRIDPRPGEDHTSSTVHQFGESGELVLGLLRSISVTDGIKSIDTIDTIDRLGTAGAAGAVDQCRREVEQLADQRLPEREVQLHRSGRSGGGGGEGLPGQ